MTTTGMYNVLERVRELEWAGSAKFTEVSPHPEVRAQRASKGEGGIGDHRGQPRPSRPPAAAPQDEVGEDQAASPAIPPLTDKERDIYDAGLIGVLKEIHDEIDRATFEAYGWEDLGERLVGAARGDDAFAAQE